MNNNEPIYYIPIYILAERLNIYKNTLRVFLGHYSLSGYTKRMKNLTIPEIKKQKIITHFVMTLESLTALKKYLMKKGNYKNDYSKAIRYLTDLIDDFKTGEINENIKERDTNIKNAMPA